MVHVGVTLRVESREFGERKQVLGLCVNPGASDEPGLLSGFLPVQSVYADFFVVDRLWPDFQPEDFEQALRWYQRQDVTRGG